MYERIVENYHKDAIRSFRNYKTLAERALEQVSEEEFFAKIDDEANSIALIVKHIGGNLHSRWTDFLTSDGEKAYRNRDSEFELIDDTREGLMKFWDDGWQTLFASIGTLTSQDLLRTVTIRSEPHSVVEAMNRQLAHYAYHVGQIVLLAKHFRSSEWRSLSIPKNRSAEFNQHVTAQNQDGATKKGVEAGFDFADKR